MDTNADGTIDYNPLEAHTLGTALPDFSSKIKVSPPASSTKSSPYKNIPLTVAQHFPARRRTLSCTPQNIILHVQKHFADRRTTLSRPPQNIILHVQKHFTDRRSGLYGTIQIILQTYDS